MSGTLTVRCRRRSGCRRMEDQARGYSIEGGRVEESMSVKAVVGSMFRSDRRVSPRAQPNAHRAFESWVPLLRDTYYRSAFQTVPKIWRGTKQASCLAEVDFAPTPAVRSLKFQAFEAPTSESCQFQNPRRFQYRFPLNVGHLFTNDLLLDVGNFELIGIAPHDGRGFL